MSITLSTSASDMPGKNGSEKMRSLFHSVFGSAPAGTGHASRYYFWPWTQRKCSPVPMLRFLSHPNYTFKVTGQEYASRFKLVLQGGEESEEPFAYFNGSEWMVSGLQEGTTMQVIDVMGRVLDEFGVTTHFSTSEWPSGVYVFRFITGDKVSLQKVIIK